MRKIKITQTRSLIGRPRDQRGTVRALGLRKIRQSVEQEDTPEIRGMITKVSHLVEYEVINANSKPKSKKSEEKTEDKS